MLTRRASIVLTLILSANIAQASVVNNLINKMAGQYSRTIKSEPTMNSEDKEISAESVEQILDIREQNASKNEPQAEVSFFLGSIDGSQPSCSGTEVFNLSNDQQSLVFDSGECSMSVSLNKAKDAVLQATEACQIEMCGAGNTLNQDKVGTVFIRSGFKKEIRLKK